MKTLQTQFFGTFKCVKVTRLEKFVFLYERYILVALAWLVLGAFGCARGTQPVESIPEKLKKPNSLYIEKMQLAAATKGCEEVVQNISEMRSALKRVAAANLKLNQRAATEVHMLGNFIADVDRQNLNCDRISEIAVEYKTLQEIIDFEDPEDIRFRLAYHPLSLQQVRRVQQDFGDLYLPESTTDWVRYEAKKTPWAGYWFPASKINTLIGRSSPMAKLDRLLKMHGVKSDIAKHERQTYAGVKRWSPWDGHCHAWAMASILFAEPVKGRGYRTRRGRVSFSIADVKAVLLKLAEAAEHKVYGVRFGSGEPSTAESYAAFQDIRPEAFHSVLVGQLKKGLPVLIDDEPKEAVWTKPVYSVSYKVSPDPALANALLVETYYLAMRELGSFKASNKVTAENSGRRYKLTYRLFHDGKKNKDGEYKIIRGEWIGNSKDRHPDVIIVPSGKIKSFNPDINKNQELIQKLLLK